MPKLGIRTVEEQSNVPLVINLNVVGIPALAMLFLGLNPPLAVISIICWPFTMLTLSAGATLVVFELPLTSITAPPIMMIEATTEIIVVFIN